MCSLARQAGAAGVPKQRYSQRPKAVAPPSHKAAGLEETPTRRETAGHPTPPPRMCARPAHLVAITAASDKKRPGVVLGVSP
jgi:hypothetical protein